MLQLAHDFIVRIFTGPVAFSGFLRDQPRLPRGTVSKCSSLIEMMGIAIFS